MTRREYISRVGEIPPFSENITNLKFNLGGNDSICMKVPKIIISSSYRNLRTLILLHVPIVTIPTKPFWKAHPNLERLELNKSVGGSWFEDFEEGMLPNLKFLKAGLMAQVDLIIPHVYRHLVSLTIPSSYNAQALYLLRGVVGGKPFPQLRYLGIHLVPRTYLSERGSDWRETEGANGSITRRLARVHPTAKVLRQQLHYEYLQGRPVPDNPRIDGACKR
ncbi:hypothetical protein BDQ17DRAFT_577047 [Cyathus striatus]|nr:hypothetical protein BDQ17DRAFT_577047 [Cyathus striatus]